MNFEEDPHLSGQIKRVNYRKLPMRIAIGDCRHFNMLIVNKNVMEEII